MKTLFFLLFFFPFLAEAQKNNSGIFQAERSFAAYAVQQGTKAAFLKFADSTGLIFEGANAVSAIETWQKREARAGVLNWNPVYGFEAASGELGFTTGPWNFQPKSITDSVVARGQYCTIWKKAANGDWKFLLDMGVNNTPAFDSLTFPFSKQETPFVPGTATDLLQTEHAFINDTKVLAKRFQTYMKSVSSVVFLLSRNGRLPVVDIDKIEPMLGTMPSSIAYTVSGAGLSASGDLGYVYGTTLIYGKQDSYLRIWRRETKEWKLAMEVLHW
jgi:ketosteroid isomerase-like protein